jgi:hypothetical protein
MIPTINYDYFCNIVNLLVFITVTQSASCEVGSEFSDVIRLFLAFSLLRKTKQRNVSIFQNSYNRIWSRKQEQSRNVVSLPKSVVVKYQITGSKSEYVLFEQEYFIMF